MNDKPILSISSNGKRREIKLNAPPGTSITTNATNAVMKNVEQKTTGGAIEHNTHDLTQIGGSQTAKNEGKIANRVEGGTLLQKNVIQSADNAGEILNEVKKKVSSPNYN